jgi:hypothetical protein
MPPAANYAALPLFYPGARDRNGAPLSFELPGGTMRTEKAQIDEILTSAADRMTKAGWLPSGSNDPDPAEAVLRGLERFSADFGELRAARGREGASFKRDVAAPPHTGFPHLTVCLHLAGLWALRMQAHLDSGKPWEAIEDLSDGLRLYSALKREPTMLSMLVKVAVVHQLQQAVQSGLVVWPDDLLPLVAEKLGTIDLAEDMRFSLESERAFIDEASEWTRQQPYTDRVRQTEETDIFELEPRGWRLWLRVVNRAEDYSEQLASNLVIDRWLLSAADGLDGIPLDGGASGSLGEAEPSKLEAIIGKVAERAVLAEAALRATRIVCALEHFRTRHGSYPATLDELTPVFLETVPRDVADAAEMRYRLKASNEFLLYSIGSNKKDDGGSSAPLKRGSGPAGPADWVWGEVWK